MSQQPLMISGKRLTLEQWLENMELDQFKDKFRDMRLGELVSYTAKDIEDLCEEFGIKMPFKKRLSDAIRVLQASKKKIELINNDKTGKDGKAGGATEGVDSTPIARTMISAEEERAFEEMAERHGQVTQSLADTQTAIDTLKQNHQNCKKNINGAFDKIIRKLNNRRQQLTERLNYEGNKKMAVIKDNKDKLVAYQSSIESCRTDADKLTMDVTMDRKTRKFRILQIEKYVAKYATSHGVKLATEGHIDDNFLKFDCKAETARKAFHFVENYGKVLVNEVPLPPTLQLIGVAITRCKVHFSANPDMESVVQKPKEWIVEYKKYTPPKHNPEKSVKVEAKAQSEANGNSDRKQPDAEDAAHDDDDADDSHSDLDLDAIGTDAQWTPKAKLTEVSEYILDGLSPNTAYCIRVCCSNDSGWSDYSPVLTVTTRAIEGGIDSKIMDLRAKKKLTELVTAQLDAAEQAKLAGLEMSDAKVKMGKSSRTSFLGGIFGKSRSAVVREEAVSMQLLYRGSRDGFASERFHAKCDFVGDTLVVVKAKETGNVFGGFARVPWKSPRDFVFGADQGAFLFSLVNTVCPRDKAAVFGIRASEVKYAVCHDPKYGPIFGNGYSLCLYDRCNEVDTNYANPVSFDFRETPNQLSGQYNFTVEEYEVFQVHVKKDK